MKSISKTVGAITLALVLLSLGRLLRADVPQVATGAWTAAGEFGTLPNGAASTVLPDGRLMVAGGTVDGHLSADIAVYDPSSATWSRAGLLAEPRADFSASALNDGHVLIAGGNTATGPTALLEVYDPASGTSSIVGAMMLPRVSAATATLKDGRVLILGGTDNTGITLALAEVYDPATDSVSPLSSSMNFARAKHTATTMLDGHVLIAGGRDRAQGNDEWHDLPSAEIYDPELNIFYETEWMTTPRSDHVAILLPQSNTVLIAGGSLNGTPLATAESYAHWSQLFIASPNPMSTPRVGAVAVPTGRSGVVLIGGGGNASAEYYGFATVTTDKNDYAPFETVTISGSGWQPGEEVSLEVSEDADSHYDWDLRATADQNGNIINQEFYPREDDVYHHIGMRFYLTAKGVASQAQTTFTDSKPNTVTVDPPSITVSPGGSAVYTVTITFNGNNNSCTSPLSVSTALPAGATASFNPTSVTSTGPFQTSTLTITTTGATPTGSTPFTVLAANGGGTCQPGTASSTGTLVVAAKKVGTVSVGVQTGALTYGTAGSATYTVTVSRIGSSGPLDANLSVTTTLPAGVTASFGTNPVHWNNGDSAAKSSTLTITTTSATPAGSTGFTVQALNPAVPGDSSTSNGTLAVGKRPVTVTFTSADKTYDGNNTAAVSGCVIATGKVGSDDVTCTVASGTFASANASAIAQTVSATAALGGTAAGNYIVTNPVTTTAKINKANAVISVSPYSVTYDGAAHTATGTATGAGGEPRAA